MEDQFDFLEIPVSDNPFVNAWTISCVEQLRLELKIKNGQFRIYYANPRDLFDLGRLIESKQVRDDFKCCYGLMKDGTHFDKRNLSS